MNIGQVRFNTEYTETQSTQRELFSVPPLCPLRVSVVVNCRLPYTNVRIDRSRDELLAYEVSYETQHRPSLMGESSFVGKRTFTALRRQRRS